MQLSVIIPTLNEAGQIASAIQHARGLAPSEVIVVDGGSSDNTVVLAKQGRAVVVSCAASRGHQLNLGAAQATGDVFLFQHADTWLAASAREQIVLALNDQAVAWGAFHQRIGAEGFSYRWLERGNSLRVGRWGLAYGDQGIFVRRQFFEQLGGFPEVPIMEDLQFSRAARNVHSPVLLPGPLHVSARRWQQQGVVRQTARNWCLFAAERLGMPPEKLARWYQPPMKIAAQTASAST